MSIIETKALEDRDGFTLRVELHDDPDSMVEDADCYDAADVRAFYAGNWGYVGVVVVASRAGVDLGRDAIWGTEYGQLANVTADPYYAVDEYDLAGEAVREATETLARLCSKGA